uniref:Disease resistance protein RGA2 n=1 Tax=Rhizophora mucronata TaxID=61149 RepID=A0A2P2MWJ6_RHIMU
MPVGEAFLSATLGVLFDRMASRPVLDFFKSQQLNAPLKKLKNKLTIINRVLDDAEDKRHTDPFVKQWHDELKDVVYDAEDLLDEIASEVQRSEIEAQSQTSLQKAQDFASSHNPFKRRKNERLEKILETLEDLVDQKDALGLMDGIGGKPSYQRTPTTWIPDESVIYGRDDDKEAIMKWVLSDHPNISNPDVLAIVGHGGLGKTTLAQHVYVSSTVPDCFDKKSWVCVAEEFDVFKVTKDILVGFTNKSSNADNLNQLQSELMLVLTDQKFFLVLDDDWNRDYSKWEDLLKPLKFGRKGSKILVTTRDEAVANLTRTSPIYPLQKLSGDDCWSLFEKHASLGTDMPSTHRDLVWIGKQIVKKCDGLPLAAKVIGGALRGKRESEDWKNILESDTWDLANDNILPVLKISYQFLQSELKRCFAYCAVFPKDCAIYKEQVIRLWMAEGLLTQSKGNEDIEQVGEGCFDDLVSRSFFQKSERKYICRGGFLMRKCFLMHDLINDLAKSISGEFCFNGVDRSCEITGRIRHLRTDGWELGKHIFTIKRVRTILLTDWAIEEEVIDRLTTLTRLRVLCWHSSNELPDAIGNLMHLRCLDLSNSTIGRLPDSVVSLWNLETLILFNCEELEELPAKISQLINLSQLDIRGTDLTRMPPHMGKLKKLGELDYYIVGEESDCSIKELGPLERLRGRLLIGNLRNVSQVQESVEANLKGKEKLKKLSLVWNDEGIEDSFHERNVLEKLQPHSNIEQLSIYGYAGTRFPDWVGNSSFSNMVVLTLEECKYCCPLPALGQLGSLKRLSIIGFEEITVVGTEFYGKSNKPPFGCLESLTFIGMRQWKEWVPYSSKDEGDGAFPLLQKLVIEDCPNLIKTLPVDLPSLKMLAIDSPEVNQLDLGPALEEIKIYNCENLKCLFAAAELKHLKRLWISSCPNLKEIQFTHLPSLTKLIITGSDSLESFSLDLGPALEEIDIWGCKGLNCLSAAAELEH